MTSLDPSASSRPLRSTALETDLIRDDQTVPAGFRSLVRPTYRASTILFDNAQAFLDRSRHFLDGYTYGLAGTPTHYALASQLARMEQSRHCVLASSGLGAIHLVNQAVLTAGDHVLIPRCAYGPTHNNAREILGANGVGFTAYDPLAGEAVRDLFQARTKLIWVESPGSITMEVQDTPAIVRVAHERGILVAADNTWASPLFFDALGHGVDFSVQALTKYAAGHSDVLLGSVCLNDSGWFAKLRATGDLMGMNVSPDDCAMVSRGLGTMAIRLQRHCDSAVKLARWLESAPGVDRVLFPALPSDPGHLLWKRDFTGASGLLSLILRPSSLEAACRFADALELFQIGASWGGIHSLAALYRPNADQKASVGADVECIVRLHIGLEDPADLQNDLAQALQAALR